LTTQVKLYVNLVNRTDLKKLNYKKAHLLDLWNTFSMHSDYDKINKSQFTELTYQKINHNLSTSKKKKILSAKNLAWCSLESASLDIRAHVDENYWWQLLLSKVWWYLTKETCDEQIRDYSFDQYAYDMLLQTCCFDSRFKIFDRYARDTLI